MDIEFTCAFNLVSAGFDAAEGDDLGECKVTPGGYAHMTHMLSGLANGRLVVALEASPPALLNTFAADLRCIQGGYCLDAISNSALAVARILVGEAPPELEPLTASELATETVWQVALTQSKYWKSISPKQVEPKDGMSQCK